MVRHCIFGSFAGGVLPSMDWSFSAVIAILAGPATLAAIFILMNKYGQRTASPAHKAV